MTTSMGLRIADQLILPLGMNGLESFRQWTRSDEFPDQGRIDYLDGMLEVDMSPEELQGHGRIKAVLGAFLEGKSSARDLGQVFVDRARLATPDAGLICGPDVVFVSWEGLRSGRVRYVPASFAQPERLMEVEGAADLVVEVVSRSSVGKDLERLPPLYARAGISELWLVDSRPGKLSLRILRLVDGAYQEEAPDEQGFRGSAVLGLRLRLSRESGPIAGTWEYNVDERPAEAGA